MTKQKTLRQGGLWDSPISSKSVARGLNFSDVRWDSDGTMAWREVRSGFGSIVLQTPDGQAPRDLNSDYSVRAKVGYGGGDFTIGAGYVYFSEEQSGRLYRQGIDSGPAKPITPGFGHFASPTLSPDARWLLFVHSYESQDALGVVDAVGNAWPRKLASGADFYMQPIWHPRGQLIAWVEWNQPNMPWDGACLRVGELSFPEDGLPSLETQETLTGDETTSVFQPLFSPDGRYLAYASDATGWWQLYIYDLETKSHRQLTTAAADHGLPAWVQGMRTYDFTPDGRGIYFIRSQDGFATLWHVEIDSLAEVHVPLGSAAEKRSGQASSDERQKPEEPGWLEQLAVAPRTTPAGEIQAAMIASGPTTPPRVIAVSLSADSTSKTRRSAAVHIRRRATAEDLAEEFYAPARSITWQGEDGESVHGLYYVPHNTDFAPSGKPPLIVSVHGGPTSQAQANFSPRAQFFATRGYALLEVNHRGSTGYGRAYWEILNGNWGIYDVEDAVSGANHLVDQELVDQARLVIMGGSAGGFTVLQALVEHPGFFKAGVCLYGVANQFTLVAETHKFEARYSDKLIGPLPEAADLYRARSPIFQAERIRDAMIIFQGEDDRVVPRAQSDEIVASLQRRGISHEYHLYPGEGHGFQKSETIEKFYLAVDRFLRLHVIYA
jgi:dipeptidyl aminopeptidase/acylaminoacyl peptidase